MRTRQRHTAGCPAFEAQIHYPFHPRFGQMVTVMYRRSFAGESHLVVEQPDRTLALIPSWMADESAGAAVVAAPTAELRGSADIGVRVTVAPDPRFIAEVRQQMITTGNLEPASLGVTLPPGRR